MLARGYFRSCQRKGPSASGCSLGFEVLIIIITIIITIIVVIIIGFRV